MGLVVLAYVVLLVVNWNDQPPSEIALEFASSIENRPAVADEDNAYLYIENNLSNGIRQEPTESEFAADLAEDCRRAGNYCLDVIASQRYGAQLWLEEQQWILDHYVELLAHTGFREPIPDPPWKLPSFGGATYGQRLLMMSAMLSALEGDQPHVIALLEADLRFWRMVLSDSDLLISKMIAAALVRNNFVFGNKILRALHKTHRTNTLPTGWLQELSDEERSVRRALIGEWQFISGNYEWYASQGHYFFRPQENKFLRFFSNAADKVLLPFLQIQDSKNRMAADIKRSIEQFDVGYRDLPDISAALTARTPGGPAPYSRLYNITGDVFFAVDAMDYSIYVTRTYDLEGVRRAAVVTSLLREQQVPMASIADGLAASPYKNPYTSAPFDLDTNTGEVVFRGLSARDAGVYRLQY